MFDPLLQHASRHAKDGADKSPAARSVQESEQVLPNDICFAVSDVSWGQPRGGGGGFYCNKQIHSLNQNPKSQLSIRGLSLSQGNFTELYGQLFPFTRLLLMAFKEAKPAQEKELKAVTMIKKT